MQTILLFINAIIFSPKSFIRIQHMVKIVVHSHFKTTEIENGIISLALLILIHCIRLSRDTASSKAQDCLVPKSKYGALPRKKVRGFRIEVMYCVSKNHRLCATSMFPNALSKLLKARRNRIYICIVA